LAKSSRILSPRLVWLAAIVLIFGFSWWVIWPLIGNSETPWFVSLPAERASAEETCWQPGMARNIGIAEQSCDAQKPHDH
jgi:hypothetical protein